MKRIVHALLVLAAGAALTGCDGTVTPVKPADSQPALSTSSAAPSGGASSGVADAAMLAESELPGSLRLIASSIAGPSDADGMPEGWAGVTVGKGQ